MLLVAGYGLLVLIREQQATSNMQQATRNKYQAPSNKTTPKIKYYETTQTFSTVHNSDGTYHCSCPSE